MKDELFHLIATKIKTAESAEKLFHDLLTPKEFHALIERFAICKLLSEGKTVRAVADSLGVATATVVRGNRMLKYDGQIVKDLM